MQLLAKMQKGIDMINDYCGKLAGYLLLVIMVIAVVEVVLRYFFNRPTIWAWGINVQLFALVAMLAVGASLRHGFFINVEVFHKRFPNRIKLIVHILTFIFSCSLCIVLIWQGWEAFFLAWQTNEHYTSYFQPPSYPVKFLVPLCGFLLLMQSIAQFSRFFVSSRCEQGKNIQ
jgi:TRAP-type mannitol/chloroaromatic compound transport system permease small subunit